MDRCSVRILLGEFEQEFGAIRTTLFAMSNGESVRIDSGQALCPKPDNDSRGI